MSGASFVRMSDTVDTRVTPPAAVAAEPRLTENVTILMEPATRAFILGTRAIEAARSEGAVARALLESSIEFYRDNHPAEYASRVARGTEILERRAAA